MGEGTFVNDLVTYDPLGSFRRQRNKAEEMQQQMIAEQQKARDELEARKKKEENDDLMAAQRTRRRALNAAGRTDYRRGTILTSPIGVPGQPGTGQKTLLGA